MKKILTLVVAATCVATAGVTTLEMAEAHWDGGWGWNSGVVIGGFGLPYGFYGGYDGGLPARYYAYGPRPDYGSACRGRNVWNGYAWVRPCY